MLVNRADSHTSGARFVSQPARWPKPLPKKTTPQTWLNFTCNFAFDQNPKTLCESKRLPKKRTFANQNAKLKRLPKRENFMLTSMLAEKERLIFCQNFCQEKISQFWKPTKPTTNKAEAAKQSQSKPSQTKTPAKNLEADFSDSTKPTWNFADEKKTCWTKKPKLKTCLLKTRLKHNLKKCRR